MKVLIYPQSINPYHEQLYRPLRAAHPGDSFTYLPGGARTIVLFPWFVLRRRLQGYRVFHVHWLEFYLDAKYGVPGTKLISLLNTVWSLAVLKLLGYKLVWTVHNTLPHEPKTSNDKFVARLVSRWASALIVHSSQTLDELHTIGADTSRAEIIPHGNYDGVYPRPLTREQARRKLGIGAQEKVALFFGNIRPYKGIEELLPAFEQLGKDGVRLVLAGKCHDAGLKKLITTFAKKHPQVLFAEGNIPDEDVAMYFDAADVVCLPFKAITTSGSAILAATFGKPLVAPRIGALRDIPQEVGVLYDPAANNALQEALTTALASAGKLQNMSRASRAYADTLAWDKLAAKTYTLYKRLG